MRMPSLGRFVAAIAALAVLAGATAAGAQPDRQDAPPCPVVDPGPEPAAMTFTVRQRAGENPVLLARGVIDEDMIPRLEAALDGFEGEEIWLDSPGGHAGIDHEAGRLIRARGFNTRIPDGWVCQGACNFMFVGGVERTVDEGGRFIVYMFEHVGDLSDTTEIERSSRMLATQDYDFLIRMGVSPRLLSDVMYRQGARTDVSGRCLTRGELMDYQIATQAGRRAANLR